MSLLQRPTYERRPFTGTLADREEQLVSDLLRLYRSGSSIVSVEALLYELRAVRKLLQEPDKQEKRQ